MKEFLTEVKIAAYQIKLNLRSEMQLKVAFISQVIGMMINDIAFVLLWFIFFQVVGKINGWGNIEVLGMQSMHTLTYGVVVGFFYGAQNLADYVSNGQLDNLLLTPRSLYMRIISSSFGVSAMGDMFFGIILYMIFAVQAQLTFLQILMTLGMVPAMCLILLNVSVVLQMVGFLFVDAGDLGHNLLDFFITPGIFPGGLFDGFLRILFLFIFPSLMISSFPIEVVKGYSIVGFLAVWVMAIFWTIMAIKLLGKARMRYESGNLIGARSF